MKIYFHDFRPEVTGEKKVLIFTSKEYEPLNGILDELNAWVERHSVDVVNIETLVLPNLDAHESSGKPYFQTSGEMSSTWHQVVRVWYRSETGVPLPPA